MRCTSYPVSSCNGPFPLKSSNSSCNACLSKSQGPRNIWGLYTALEVWRVMQALQEAIVTLHTILLNVGGVIYAPHALPSFIQLCIKRFIYFMNQPDVSSVAFFVAKCLALFPWFFLVLSVSFLAAGFYFLFPQTPAQMPIRGIYSAVTLPYLAAC